MFEEVETTMII